MHCVGDVFPGVNSANSTWATSFGLIQRHSFIFVLVLYRQYWKSFSKVLKVPEKRIYYCAGTLLLNNGINAVGELT
jgi:hypothetical protein